MDHHLKAVQFMCLIKWILKFGDASGNLHVSDIAASADLDKAQVYQQSILPKPSQVP